MMRFGGGPGYVIKGAEHGFGILRACVFMSGLLLIVAAAVVITYLILKKKGHNFSIAKAPSSENNNNALNILNERYAKGEIAEEEYLKIKTNLNS